LFVIPHEIFLTKMIELFFFESESDAIEAAQALQKLGGPAKTLLSECIEHQEITRKTISKAAKSLEDEGFVFIRESDDIFEPSVQIKPTLRGEEAMDVLEFLSGKQH